MFTVIAVACEIHVSSCLCLWGVEAIVFPLWQILSPLFLPVATGGIAFASSLGAESRTNRNLVLMLVLYRPTRSGRGRIPRAD